MARVRQPRRESMRRGLRAFKEHPLGSRRSSAVFKKTPPSKPSKPEWRRNQDELDKIFPRRKAERLFLSETIQLLKDMGQPPLRPVVVRKLKKTFAREGLLLAQENPEKEEAARMDACFYLCHKRGKAGIRGKFETGEAYNGYVFEWANIWRKIKGFEPSGKYILSTCMLELARFEDIGTDFHRW